MGIFVPEVTPMMDRVACMNGAIDPATFFFSGWMGASVAALMLSLILLVIIYFFAVLAQNQNAMTGLRLEVYELGVTTMIVLFLFLMINGLCEFKTGWIFPNDDWKDESVYYSAANHLASFSDYTLRVMSIQYYIYVMIDYVTSAELSAVPMGIGATLRPTAGLGSAVKPVFNNAFNAETIAVITAQAQIYVLDFGTYGLLRYFLPLAIVLRSFLQTRRLGGAIIAIICTFLFIYPFLTIAAYEIVNAPLKSSLEYITSNYPNPMTMLKLSFFLLFEFLFKWLWGPDFLMLYALVTMPATAAIFIGGVFMPLFNTLILTSTARTLSKTLGEEIDITNLTRMI